jgi:hypothetical protein
MAKESQYRLLEAIKAHIASLEAERERASGHSRAILDQRLEAAGRVLGWLSTRPDIGSSSNTAATALEGRG